VQQAQKQAANCLGANGAVLLGVVWVANKRRRASD